MRVAFLILEGKHFKSAVTLTRNMLISVGTEPPETIITYDKLAFSPNMEVNLVDCRSSENRWTKTKRREKWAEEDEEENTPDW